MRFSVGILDAFFGEKVVVEARQDDGTVKKTRVTKAWLERMETQGKLKTVAAPKDEVHVHLVGPDGLQHTSVIIGKDIPEQRYRSLVDPETGALYALKFYKNGKPETMIIKREVWDLARQEMGL